MKDVIISVMLTPTEPTPPKGYRIVGFGIRGLCKVGQPTLSEAVAHASKQFSQTTQLACYAAKHEDEANARLMAAAPELLRELIDFHDHWIDQGEHECDGIPGGCPVQAAIDKATKPTA